MTPALPAPPENTDLGFHLPTPPQPNAGFSRHHEERLCFTDGVRVAQPLRRVTAPPDASRQALASRLVPQRPVASVPRAPQPPGTGTVPGASLTPFAGDACVW